MDAFDERVLRDDEPADERAVSSVMSTARPRRASSSISPSSPSSESLIDRLPDGTGIAGGADHGDARGAGGDAGRRVRGVDPADCDDRDRDRFADLAEPLEPDRRIRIRLRRRRPDRPGADVGGSLPLRVAAPRPPTRPRVRPAARLRAHGRRRASSRPRWTPSASSESAASTSSLTTNVASSVAESAPARDDLRGRRALHPQLDHGGALLDGAPRRLELLDEDVEPHRDRARRSCPGRAPPARRRARRGTSRGRPRRAPRPRRRCRTPAAPGRRPRPGRPTTPGTHP